MQQIDAILPLVVFNIVTTATNFFLNLLSVLKMKTPKKGGKERQIANRLRSYKHISKFWLYRRPTGDKKWIFLPIF